MPLLDHFNPPLNRTHPWRSFHGAWAAAMARLLNQGVLPSGYYAVPLVDRDGPIEIDVAALREQGAPVPASGTAWPQTWVAPAPALAVAVDLPAVDGVEVQVFADDGDPRLAAAVELLSPRNKDRPAARQAFAVKCVGYLQQGSSVVVVDTVTTRRADLNGTILSLLGVDVSAAALPLSSLSAVSYRAVGREEEPQQLQVWPAPLALAQPLPTLPLWIAPDFSVPLDLEASYQMTCADLRIRHAGDAGSLATPRRVIEMNRKTLRRNRQGRKRNLAQAARKSGPAVPAEPAHAALAELTAAIAPAVLHRVVARAQVARAFDRACAG